MVKPPKSWLDEYNAIHKSKQHFKDNLNHNDHESSRKYKKKRPRGGSSSFGSNMDNTFRHYMARKINLQRDQFGLILPPPPTTSSTSPSPSQPTLPSMASSFPFKQKEQFQNGNKVEHNENEPSITSSSKKKKMKSVWFKNNDNYPMNLEEKRDNIDHSDTTTSGMKGVLNRLKQKHGFQKKKSRSRRRGYNSISIGIGKCSKSRENKKMMKMKKEKKPIVFEDEKEGTSFQEEEVNQSDEEKEDEERINESCFDENKDDILTCQSGCSIEEEEEEEEEEEKEETTQFRATSSNIDPMTNAKGTESQTTSNFETTFGCDNNTNNHTNDDDDFEESSTTSSSPKSKRKKIPTYHELKCQRPDLFFLGITVMVNGYTNPSSETIMRTMHRYGGNLEKYETDQITHIIAEHLSTAKANIYKKQKKPIPVVYPKWIVDCVDAKKLLPYQDYLLDEVKDDSLGTTVSVKSYFSKAKTNSDKQDSNCSGDVPLKKGDGLKSTDTQQMNQSVSANNPTQGNIFSSSSRRAGNDIVLSPQKNHNELATAKPVRSKIFGPRTVGNDPNFLDAYFANSRLSFIGSFKQRVQSKPLATGGSKLSPRNNREGAESYVYHVDMDCFFAAIAVRNYPQYKNKPVAVGHAWKSDLNGLRKEYTKTSMQQSISSASKNSTSELSTCNYVARKFGVRKGMFAQRALQLCPDLVILPYDYEGYEGASSKVAQILEQHSQAYCGIVEQVSCDEFYVELSFHADDTDGCCDLKDLAQDVGNRIRVSIVNETECTASIGIGKNKLLAKLATNKVKEREGNGVHLVDNVKSFLSNVKLRDLPGVGYRLEKKLQARNLFSICDVWSMGNDTELCSILGKGNGSKIYMYCQGLDTRPVKAADRKTIGAECNYGVRFNGPYGVDHMMAGLAKEVVKRMTNVGVKGKHITIKVKEQRENAPPPGKFNGHGKCNDHSKSYNLPVSSATRDLALFCREGMRLFNEIGIHPDRVRGMGMVISKLDNEHEINQCKSKDKTDRWFKDPSRNQRLQQTPDRNRVDNSHLSNTVNSNSSNCSFDLNEVIEISETSTPIDIQLPPLEEISMDEVMALPSDLRENVLDAIKERENTNSNISFQGMGDSLLSTFSFSNPSPISSKANSKPLQKKKAKIVPSKIIHSSGQVDMKRMMKLVAVKSGQEKVEYDGERVSLTQLGHLPLDIQLQIANSDEVVMNKPRSKAHNAIQSKARKALFSESIEIESPMNPVESDTDIEILSCGAESHEEVEEGDIAFLCRWLGERLQPSQEDVMILKDFICVCITEHRLDDAVTFLRLVKRKASTWSPGQYSQLLKECNRHLMYSQGRILDVIRLGL